MAVSGQGELRVTVDGESQDLAPADLAKASFEEDGAERQAAPGAAPGSGTLQAFGARRRVLWRLLGTTAEGARRLEVVVDGWRFEATVEPAARARLRERARHGAADAVAHPRLVIRAPIPGRIGAVRVTEGEAVESGQTLLMLEAMKMANEVRAPRAGTIERVAVVTGRTVELGDPLVELA
jgi:biotin carboxyl carrier protein